MRRHTKLTKNGTITRNFLIVADVLAVCVSPVIVYQLTNPGHSADPFPNPTNGANKMVINLIQFETMLGQFQLRNLASPGDKPLIGLFHFDNTIKNPTYVVVNFDTITPPADDPNYNEKIRALSVLFTDKVYNAGDKLADEQFMVGKHGEMRHMLEQLIGID